MRFARDSLLSASVLLRLSIMSSYCVEKLNLQSLKHSMDALKAARIFLIFCVTPASSSRIEDAQLPPMSSHLTFLMILSCFLRATTSCAIESYVTDNTKLQHTKANTHRTPFSFFISSIFACNSERSASASCYTMCNMSSTCISSPHSVNNKHASHLILLFHIIKVRLHLRAVSLRFLLCMHTLHLKCATCQAHASVPAHRQKANTHHTSFSLFISSNFACNSARSPSAFCCAMHMRHLNK